VLFPTPHSAVQDMLGQQMKRVFAERIARQRSARAHDALVMKVLQHVGEKPLTAPFPGPAPPASAAPVELDVMPGRRAAPAREARKTAPPPRRGSRWRVVMGALLLVALGGAAGFAAHAYVRPGALVVTSDPPGAQVALEGRPAAVAPAVFEDLPPGELLTVVVSAPDHKTVTLALQPELGRLVRRVHAQLPVALGAVTIESEPPGAQVQIDDRPAGVTPLTIQNVRLDERHRVDLALPGHELDQFVVLPEHDGQRFHRALAPVERRGARAREAE